jgi:hypothetical protein
LTHLTLGSMKRLAVIPSLAAGARSWVDEFVS